MKERKKQKQKERQPEREDKETTPRPSKESASVTLVVDPDSKKARRRKDTDKGKEKDGEKEEWTSQRTPTSNEPPIVGEIRVEANDRVRDESTRGSSSSSHHEGRPDPSSAATAATPASAGTSKTRRASTSPTTPTLPRKYPSTLPHGSRSSGVPGFVDLTPCGEWVGRRDVPYIKRWCRCLICSATATTSATADESEAHSRSRQDTHHHHPHHHHPHHRRSRRNSVANRGGTSNTPRPRNNDSADRRAAVRSAEHLRR
jgi:hypothetical protein